MPHRNKDKDPKRPKRTLGSMNPIVRKGPEAVLKEIFGGPKPKSTRPRKRPR